MSTPILEQALILKHDGEYNYRLEGSNYIGEDLPDNFYKYGYATIKVRGNDRFVILWGCLNNTLELLPIAINAYNKSNNIWCGWKIYNYS